MVTWRERRILAAGHSIAVFETGSTALDARTLVLIHGLGHWTQAAWNRLVPLLDPDLRIAAFDLPGFGSSERPDVRYDSAFFGRITVDVLAQLAPGPAIVAGHSLGGFIAANYAAAHPERIAKLILIAPAGFLRTARFVYALLGSQLARRLFTRRPSRTFVRRMLVQSVVDRNSIDEETFERAYVLAQEADVRRAFAGVYTGAMRDFRDAGRVHARLRAYTGPALIVWGRNDRFIPIDALPQTRAVYPQAAVLICERSGHLPMVEEAAAVARAMNDFTRATDVTPS
ncbi:MAG: alpha/beta fold hydrolase [Candidatus Velthaea sp.]